MDHIPFPEIGQGTIHRRKAYPGVFLPRHLQELVGIEMAVPRRMSRTRLRALSTGSIVPAPPPLNVSIFHRPDHDTGRRPTATSSGAP
jgi:hypothetical protein